MTLALLLHPPSCSSLSLSSPARDLHILAFGSGLLCPKFEQWYGGHLGDRSITRRAIIRRQVAPFQRHAALSFKMQDEQGYRGVVVGGTFDRLHQGHTLLLTKALSLVTQGGRLVVGISNGPLLSEKSLSERIEPINLRVGAVDRYLKHLAESKGQFINIHIEIEEAILEQAVSDPQLDCIVVSQETEVGVHLFNNCRIAKGFPPLKVVVVDVLDESAGVKCSSSPLCRQSLGTFIPRANGDRLSEGPLVTGPYMVGLTGGIASGKSFVCSLLENKGAQVLDCDALGHLSYVPGTPTYHAMVAAFGQSIISPADGAIDRQTLGSIVFNDPNQMQVLKNIVWEYVGRLVAEKKERMAEQGGKILVAEAALLLEAHWEKEMHEIWVVVAPQDVSCHRLMSRNKISAEEANKRIRSQMSSDKRIALADVVVYNGWTQDETKEHVEIAWDLLLQRVRLKFSQCEKVEEPLWFRWAGLMRRLCINNEVALKWWAKLRNNYSEPWRHYYTFMQIQALYAHYHEYAHFIAQPHVFQLAMLFHRIVHHPSALATNENEFSSAGSFKEFATEAGLRDVDRENVIAFILISSSNISDEAAVTGDLAFFLDFNLAVLASTSQDYKKYKAKVRQEFKDYDDEHFETIFKNQLQRCTNGTQIFHTDIFREKYLSAAWANLCEDASLKNLYACL